MVEVQLQIADRVLDNGLTVMAIHNEGVRTFAAAVVLDVDVRDERSGEEGLANLVGECLDEGTKMRSGVELAEAADDIGSTLHGSAAGSMILGPADTIEPALGLLREMVFEPVFAERGVLRVRDEILQEIQVDAADPQTVANLRFRAEVYGSHPYARPARGDAKSVAAHAPSDLSRFHEEWYAPDGGYAVASGPQDVSATLDLLEATFGGIAGGDRVHVRPEAPALPDPAIDIHIPMDREQVHVYLGHPGIRRVDPDFYALAVMDYILGTGPGFTSRISKRLRDDMGLCYAVQAGITATAGEEPGTFGAYIGTSAEHREKAIAGFLEEIERIREEKVTEKELADVVEYLTGSYVFAFERNIQLVRYGIRARRFDLGFDHIREYPELIRSVTREDVLRVAEQHLRPERMVRVSAGAGANSDAGAG